MAGDWIPVCTDLHGKPEVARLSAALGKPIDEIVGTLIRFWIWVQAHTADGSLEGLGVAEASAASQVSARFISELQKVGWLQITDAGLMIPQFDRWFSGAAKRRLMTNQRVAQHRERYKNVTTGKERIEQENVVVDVVVEEEKGGAGGKTAPPSDGDAVTLQAFQRVGRLWGRNGPTSRRDRVLLWRVCRLAACGESWAKACLDALAEACPSRPGAYLQKMAIDVGPRVPNVAVSLADVPVPPEIEAVPRPPRPRAETARGQEQETPLTAEERRAMMAEVMAVLRKGNRAGTSPRDGTQENGCRLSSGSTNPTN